MKCFFACPAKALVKSALPMDENEGQLLEFTPSRCNRCGVCVDVCLEHCISLLPEVQVDHLLDFEPQILRTAPRPAWMNAGIRNWLNNPTNSQK